MTQSTSEVWTWFQTSNEDVYPIGSEPDFGVEIYAERDKDGLMICVEIDGELVYEEDVYDVEDCARVINIVCDTYLTPAAFSILAGEGSRDDAEEEQQMLIEEREDELDGAFYDLLSVVLDGCILSDIDDICDDVKEHLLEYIYKKYELPIYRPMILTDEDGKDFYEEFPYECMVFDDEE